MFGAEGRAYIFEANLNPSGFMDVIVDVVFMWRIAISILGYWLLGERVLCVQPNLKCNLLN